MMSYPAGECCTQHAALDGASIDDRGSSGALSLASVVSGQVNEQEAEHNRPLVSGGPRGGRPAQSEARKVGEAGESGVVELTAARVP
jgi:hypothetical protein